MSIANSDDLLLITGSNGFIGSKVVESLIQRGYSNLRCFVRPSSDISQLEAICSRTAAKIQIFKGNLLSRRNCAEAVKDVALVYHLAAGMEKTYAGCFMNSVVATRNLLDAIVARGQVRRFVNVSSFAVYSNWSLPRGGLLDESCALETKLVERAEPYTFAKLRQDQLVAEYAEKYGLPFVTMRPGAVYGPGTRSISARVGIDTFGVFLHMGGANRIPLTYVENCAEAIALGGVAAGAEGKVFNIVDDDLPTSREFLRMYKNKGKKFASLFIPYWLSYRLCCLWEWYSHWSEGQLPPAFNRWRCAAYWKGNRYSNARLKQLGWTPRVSFAEGADRFFAYVRESR